jgi:guanylate kinase
MSKGKLFVISGASGVGKGTVLSRVMEKRSGLEFSVSVTTRGPRPNEIPGVHYDYVTQEFFDEMIREDGFLEYSCHHGGCYGTPRAQVESKLECGHTLLDIDPNGAKQVIEKCPDTTLIFIMPPSEEELERRLRGRGDTPAEQIEGRLKRAKWEMEQRYWYHHVVVNDVVEECADKILDIISAVADTN